MTAIERRAPSVGAGRAHLGALLEASLEFDSTTRDGLVNHLPMGLEALDALGASDARLDALFDEYLDRCAVVTGPPPELEGRRAELAVRGIAAALRSRLDPLVEAPGSGWFHSAIRVAHATASGHDGELALALWDWEQRACPMPDPVPGSGTSDLAEVVPTLAGLAAVGGFHHADLAGVADLPGFAAAMRALGPAACDLDELGAFALSAHLARPDLVTLHLVTGTHAARVLTAWVAPARAPRLVARTVQAVAAGFVAAGAPAPLDPSEEEELRATPVPPWAEVASAAVASGDVHVAKLVVASRESWRRTGDPLHRVAAARVVGLA